MVDAALLYVYLSSYSSAALLKLPASATLINVSNKWLYIAIAPFMISINKYCLISNYKWKVMIIQKMAYHLAIL